MGRDEHQRPGPSTPRWLDVAIVVTAFFVIVVGVVALIGWHVGSATLVQLRPDWTAMKYNTALCFVLLGAAGLFRIRDRVHVGTALAGAAGAISVATLLEYALDRSFGIDELIVQDFVLLHTSHEGRMAPTTAAAFVLAAAGFLALHRRSPGRQNLTLAALAAGCLVIMGAVPAIGYLARMETAYGIAGFTYMALPTAVAVIMLGALLVQFTARATMAAPANLAGRVPMLAGAMIVVMAVFFWYVMLAEFRTRLAEIAKVEAVSIQNVLQSSVRDYANTLTRVASRWRHYGQYDQAQWDDETAFHYAHFPALASMAVLSPTGAVQSSNSSRGEHALTAPTIEKILQNRPAGQGYSLTPGHDPGTLAIAVPFDLPEDPGGLLVGLLEFAPLIQAALDGSTRALFGIEFSKDGHRIVDTGVIPAMQSTYFSDHVLDFDGVTLDLRLRPALNTVRAWRSYLPEVVLGAGSLMAVLFAATLHLYNRHATTSSALAVINTQLRDNITARDRMQQELRRVNRVLRVRSQCYHAIATTSSEEDMLRLACRSMVEDGGYRLAWVGYARHDPERSIEPIAWYGDDETYVIQVNARWDNSPRGQGPSGTAIRERRPVRFDMGAEDARFAPWRAMASALNLNASLAVPLMDEREVIGVMNIYAQAVDQFDDHEQRLLEECVGVISFGIGALRAAEARAEAAQYARRLIEASLDPLVTISADGTITDVNEATVRATGVSRQTIIGTDFCIYFTEPEKARHGYQQVFAQGVVTDYPLTIQHVDGQLMDVLYNATVYRDAQERVVGVFAAARDVTEQKQASQYARSLIEASLDPLVTISANGRIMDVNEAAVAVTGVERSTLIGTDFCSYFTEPDRAREGYLHVFAQGFVTDYPLTIQHKDGRQIDVLYNASVYRDTRGEVLGVFAAARDVTARKRMERELELHAAALARSNEELQQFAYVASHDLQEPLRAIAGYLQLLEHKYAAALEDGAKHYIERSVAAAGRMQQLIQDLLAYSRVSTRGSEFKPVNLDQVLAKVLLNCESAIEDAGAVIVTDALPEIAADETQMLQLFQNLLSNALKFHGEEKPVIRISARRIVGGYEFAVADNGIGIDQAYFDRIFVIFQRLHSRTEYPGTGMGLTLCKRIAERHGGRIWVESHPGQGSTFYFTLTAEEQHVA